MHYERHGTVASVGGLGLEPTRGSVANYTGEYGEMRPYVFSPWLTRESRTRGYVFIS